MTHHLDDEPRKPAFDPWHVEVERVLKWREEHRCPECWRVTDSRTRPGNEHWPYCSKATIEQKSAWARRKELRAKRSFHG